MSEKIESAGEADAEEPLDFCLEDKIRRVYALTYVAESAMVSASTTDQMARVCINEMITLAADAAKDLYDSYHFGAR